MQNFCFKTSFGEVVLAPDWASGKPEYREKIRAELYKKSRDAVFLDLSTPPKAKNFSVSISHCKSMGGYALNLVDKIGFDVEQIERLTVNLLKRVSTYEERELLSGAPAQFLWVIKEAAYKKMSHKISLMSEVKLIFIDKQEEHFFTGVVSAKGSKCQFLCGYINKDCIFAIVK